MTQLFTPTVPAGIGDVVMRRMFPVADPYRDDPAGWANEVLGEETWSKQDEILESIVDHRYTGVQSCHGAGKSFTASRAVAWWLSVHDPGEAFAVTTAPTAPQIEAILWREIGRAHRKGGLRGYTTQGAVPMWKIDSEIVAYGRKPQDLKTTEEAMQAFQGIHARYVLVVLDEAGGIPRWLWDAVDSLVTNDDSRVLAIGNPDNPASHFAQVMKPGSGWNRLRIDAFETPNFTDEEVSENLEQLLVSKTWVRERIKRWGKGSPLYLSKVRGLFPKVSDDTLIPPALIEAAQQRSLPGLEVGRYGADVARFGDDESVVYRNREGVIRLTYRGHKQSTMKTAGALGRLVREKGNEVPMVIDIVGLGAGIYDRLAELDLAVHPFQGSEQALRPEKFKNRRAEGYWALRELMEAGLIDLDPDDDDLAAELSSIKWWTDSSGRIVMEPKENQKRRLGKSPDRADAVMMSCVAPPVTAATVPMQTLTSDLLEKVM